MIKKFTGTYSGLPKLDSVSECCPNSLAGFDSTRQYDAEWSLKLRCWRPKTKAQCYHRKSERQDISALDCFLILLK